MQRMGTYRICIGVFLCLLVFSDFFSATAVLRVFWCCRPGGGMVQPRETPHDAGSRHYRPLETWSSPDIEKCYTGTALHQFTPYSGSCQSTSGVEGTMVQGANGA